MTDDRELPVAETLSSAKEELRTWRIRALQAEAEVREAWSRAVSGCVREAWSRAVSGCVREAWSRAVSGC
eukprot:symbB.v1.2.037555.t1/scaffold5580.1/size55073/1